MAAERATVGITGATGYVGRMVEQRLRAHGCTTVPLARRPPSDEGTWRSFDLGAPVASSTLAGIDTLVHCAWDLRVKDRTAVWRTNVDGTTRLLDAARVSGVRVVFVSSMSAYDGTTQLYGLSKLACEDAVISAGGTVTRLGLVYGPHGGGMAGALAKLTRLPVTPLVCPSARQFTVHEDDMAVALVRLVLSDKCPPGPLGLAHPEAVPFRSLLEGIAAMEGKHPRFVRVPTWSVYGALRVSELAGLDVGFRSDSLLGLMKPARHVPGADVLARLGISLRPFPTTGPAPSV